MFNFRAISDSSSKCNLGIDYAAPAIQPSSSFEILCRSHLINEYHRMRRHVMKLFLQLFDIRGLHKIPVLVRVGNQSAQLDYQYQLQPKFLPYHYQMYLLLMSRLHQHRKADHIIILVKCIGWLYLIAAEKGIVITSISLIFSSLTTVEVPSTVG